MTELKIRKNGRMGPAISKLMFQNFGKFEQKFDLTVRSSKQKFTNLKKEFNEAAKTTTSAGTMVPII